MALRRSLSTALPAPFLASARPVLAVSLAVTARSCRLITEPDDRDEVVLLPQGRRFTSGELRPTIAEIKSQTLDNLRKTMNDPANWESLFARFDYEQALSGYIATYPHNLEDGLTVHPTLKVRELPFMDRTRSDVILLDRHDARLWSSASRASPQSPPSINCGVLNFRRPVGRAEPWLAAKSCPQCGRTAWPS